MSLRELQALRDEFDIPLGGTDTRRAQWRGFS